MKLARFEFSGQTRLGLVEGDAITDLSAAGLRYETMQALIADQDAALPHVREIGSRAQHRHALAGVRLLAPIERPGKYLAIGMNYAKHVAEAVRFGASDSPQQMWFNKQTTCISGPNDDIDPGVTAKLDYEVELGVVMGRVAKRVSESSAADHIFGYFVANDVSARDWQFHSKTFTVGKSFDTHGPIGPWIVTADEISDPHGLALRCFVNGEKRQDGNTRQMIATIWQQIAYLSTAFTLEPGDLLATGTPEGVGAGMDPPGFLAPGDVVRCEIDNIGSIENRVREPRV